MTAPRIVAMIMTADAQSRNGESRNAPAMKQRNGGRNGSAIIAMIGTMISAAMTKIATDITTTIDPCG